MGDQSLRSPNTMRTLLLVCLISLTGANKIGKNIGIFNVVKFPNDACDGNNQDVGTCYTAEECENLSGTASGSCADGYGVCCVFTINCGGTSSQNLTTFMSNNVVAGSCAATICPLNSDIVQLRLDFTTFVIAPPQTGTAAAQFLVINGQVNNAAGMPYTADGQCLADAFSVTAPGGVGSPVICGTNTNEHMYIDASDSCNMLTFQIGNAPVAVTQQWSIRVTQYEMSFPNKAPKGCLQYHFAGDGDNDGNEDATQIRSFNWNAGNGRHLANQDYNICIRREATNSRICYSQAGTTTLNDFIISDGLAGDAALAAAMGLWGKDGLQCGNYGATGKGIGSKADFDYLNIPGASTAAPGTRFIGTGGPPITMINNGNFCGAQLAGGAANSQVATAAMMAANQATVCSRVVPFQVRFVTDAGETITETVQSGFQLGYILT